MREFKVQRKTAETTIEVELCLDGKGIATIDTGIGFFNHMLTLMAVHGKFDLMVKAQGDLDVDAHHTVEDVGICLGKALDGALGNRSGINRYGSAKVPMDEALAEVVIDLSRRPYLVYKVPPLREMIGAMPSELVPEFLRAFSQHGGVTLHAIVHYGSNSHHIVEALFKALGKSLYIATRMEGFYHGIPSSKGAL